VAAEAEDQGIAVTGVDRLPWRGPAQNVTFHEGLFEDAQLLDRLLPGCDGIIHTAGLHGGDLATHDLASFVESNVAAVGRLLEQAHRHRVRGVALSSTMEVVLGRDWISHGLAVVDEDTAPQTDSAYSLGKLLMEQLARGVSSQTGLSVASLRFMAFGSGSDRRGGPGLLARALTARDAARAAIRAALRDDLRGEVIHIGPATPLTNADIAEAVVDPERALERHYPGAGSVLRRLGIPLTSENFWPVTRTRRAKLLLGWEPLVTFEQWLRENGWAPPCADADPARAVEASVAK
jgi:nucleoside-diphosphate-sugar epimerase